MSRVQCARRQAVGVPVLPPGAGVKKIAVLIPAFNAGKTISLAVESMLWQAVPDGYSYEVDVLDDGSTDDTLEILRRIAAQRRGSALRVLSNEGNLGIVRSLNRLIEASDADYFVRMDADDVSLPGRIVAQIETLEAGQDLVGTSAYNFGSMHGDRQYSGDRLHHTILAMVDQRSFCHPTIAFNRKVARIGYKEQPAEDYGLLTDVLLAGLDLTNIPRHYLMYRVHDQSLSSSADRARFARLRESVCSIRARYLSGLLGVDGDDAAAYSVSIEKKIFRRNTPGDLAALERLRGVVRDRLRVDVDFMRF